MRECVDQVGMLVGDCLDYVYQGESTSLKPGSSIPWVWVLNHMKAEQVHPQLICMHFTFHLNVSEIISITN